MQGWQTREELMFKFALRVVAVATTLAAGTMLAHAENPMVGGAAMYPVSRPLEAAF